MTTAAGEDQDPTAADPVARGGLGPDGSDDNDGSGGGPGPG